VVAALQASGAPVEYQGSYDGTRATHARASPNRLDCYPRVEACLQRAPCSDDARDLQGLARIVSKTVTSRRSARRIAEAVLRARRVSGAADTSYEEALGCSLWLKCEQLHSTGSFISAGPSERGAVAACGNARPSGSSSSREPTSRPFDYAGRVGRDARGPWS